ncbi:hypothetical protein [Methanobrevibacter sp.]|uniref:hypothetical protein n=1 Tax=Methanobrevibacter sp. TaxID=66852 RepID=UPI0026E06192|nr:hypothetical protein [Methanobrevibacter sp.]MDO5823809.1 hypothetical protein [Methanobrevibacter sp.]
MDILITVIYLILFIVMMVFVFSIGMLKQYMPKREVVLVLVVAFLIGSIGGAFFLDPIYDELPSVISAIEKTMPNNEETLYLDLSSSVNINELKNKLNSTDGFKSFDEKSITIPMWSFNEREHDYFDRIVGNIDSHYKSHYINSSEIQITLEENYTSAQALKSFSDWYKLVYGGTISYAQVHAVLVVDSSALDRFEEILLEDGIVASKIEGPIQDSINNTNSSMLSNIEFTLICGGVGVVVALMGIYIDSVVPKYRKFRKVLREKRKR